MYILVTGPYDSTFVGPFTDRPFCNKWIAARQEVANAFDFCIMTNEEMAFNIRQFGPCPTASPTDWKVIPAPTLTK